MKTNITRWVSLVLVTQSTYASILVDLKRSHRSLILSDNNDEFMKSLPYGLPSKFKGKVFKNLNLSGQDLQDYEFIDCTFINVDLTKSDLRNTIFKGSTFLDVFLKDALLCDGFKFDGELSNGDLVRQYSGFMDKGESDKARALNGVLGPLQLQLCNEDFSSFNLTGINLEKSQILGSNFKNSVLTDASFKDIQISSSLLSENYSNTSFKEALLEEINLTNATTYYAKFKEADFNYTDLSKFNLRNTSPQGFNLKGIWLSGTLQLPDYKHPNEIFYLWKNANEKDKPFLGQLIHTGINMFDDVPYEDLASINWEGSDLHGANLQNADLHGLNFKNANLKDAVLTNANLEGADFTSASLESVSLKSATLQNIILTDANLKNTILNDQSLQQAKLSNDVVLPNYQNASEIFYFWRDAEPANKPFFQKLIHCGFNMFGGVPYEDLALVSWRGLDLHSANFSYADLHGLDFSNSNLRGAILSNTNMQNSNFKNANLSNTNFGQMTTNAQNATFINTDFENSNMILVNFTGANFTGANFKRASLMLSNLNSAILINAKLENTILSGAELQNVQLSDTLKIPPYQEASELFYFWRDANQTDKPFCQLLINSGVLMFGKVPYQDLSSIKWSGLNLANSFLVGADLHNLDFTNTSFEGANLSNVNLQNATLINANLENSLLNYVNYGFANLEGAILKDTKMGNTTLFYFNDLFENRFMLPKNFTDADLIHFQSRCFDNDVRQLLSQIIAGRKKSVKQENQSNSTCQIL